jgi:hypothetical protein
VVATNGQAVGGHKQIADLGRLKWAGDAITQIDRAIDVPSLDVGKHGFERRQVPVDVSDHGDTHSITASRRSLYLSSYPPSGQRRPLDEMLFV